MSPQLAMESIMTTLKTTFCTDSPDGYKLVRKPTIYSMVADGHSKGYIIENLLLYPKYNLAALIYTHIIKYIQHVKERTEGKQQIHILRLQQIEQDALVQELRLKQTEQDSLVQELYQKQKEKDGIIILQKSQIDTQLAFITTQHIRMDQLEEEIKEMKA